MKKLSILLVVLVVVCAGCILPTGSGVNELEKKVEQLQKDVAELQKANGMKPNNPTPPQSTKKTAEKDGETVNQSEQQAMEAVKYCLKKYVSDLKYDKMTSVPKSDGTVDVIIDYKYLGDVMHTYYNVSVYSNGECRINDITGWVDGHFPHGDKFSVQ